MIAGNLMGKTSLSDEQRSNVGSLLVRQKTGSYRSASGPKRINKALRHGQQWRMMRVSKQGSNVGQYKGTRAEREQAE